MDINNWLVSFKKYWENSDVENILTLFSDDVAYFETPFIQLKNFEELIEEWQIIKKQKNINLDFKVFLSCENKHSVIWKLEYNNQEEIEKNFSGTYLIQLNDEGLCDYFHHTCESK